jgi:pimeloyl-ACP methyl ester carboxylesterase
MSTDVGQISEGIPELFYDLLSILTPGVYLLVAVTLLFGGASLEWISNVPGLHPTLVAFFTAYVAGHLIYSFSSITVAKLFIFLSGQPIHDLLITTQPPTWRDRLHGKMNQLFFIGFPRNNRDLASLVERAIQRITHNPSFKLTGTADLNVAYELCRNYVMERTARRALAIRKEQAYGEMARGGVFVTLTAVLFICIILLFKPEGMWGIPPKLEQFLPYQLAGHMVALVGFAYRYAQARGINPLLIYSTFSVLLEEEARAGSLQAGDTKGEVTMNNATKKIDFDLQHGRVEGVYMTAGARAPLVVITNGHNGFYNYGMFPYIQETLHKQGISTYSYNFSHGGVTGNGDYFDDLERYEKNCMRLETADLLGVVAALQSAPINLAQGTPLYLLSHSLGSVPTIFAARQVEDDGHQISGLILLAPVKTLDVWPAEMMRDWEKNGVYPMKNNRTNQELPQGSELLAETKQANDEWSVEQAMRDVHSRFLIIHGANDNDVPFEHSESITRWAREAGNEVQLNVVPNAGHTFNTKHPFQGPTPELEEMLRIVTSWIRT